MKILSVVGCRPQFIKSTLVSQNLNSEGIKEVLVHTGQHYDYNLSGIFFDELKLKKPDYNLGIGSYSHSEQVARMMYELEKVVNSEKPDIVLTYGDTNSTMAGALVAAKCNIPVAHVEAGERNFDRSPEEINRIVTDHISDYLFCCTYKSCMNLVRENMGKERINEVGDVMFDLFNITMPYALDKSKILKTIGMKKNYILATIHRPENTDNAQRLKNIITALIMCGRNVVFPIHLRTERFLKEHNLYKMLRKAKNVYCIDPVGYMDNLVLIANSDLVVTDSGGIQKEAAFANKKVIVCRKNTEWQELVFADVVRLADDNVDRIIHLIKYAKGDAIWEKSIFGNGDAALKIVEVLKNGKRNTEGSRGTISTCSGGM